METIQDFEDMLSLLNKHDAHYLIVGGLAFIYHAKPRYTKDIDIWVDSANENLKKVNDALVEFGSPYVLTFDHPEQILQIGVEPDRIDFLQKLAGVKFPTAWKNRVTDNYGDIETYWIDLDDLICVKKDIDHPRHKEDVRILQKVKKLRAQTD